MLLIFDKDGTITETKDGGACPTTPDNQILLPGIREMLSLWHSRGDTITIVSNQGGVSFGQYTEMQAWSIVLTLNEMLGGIVSDIKLGFYHPEGPLHSRYIDKRKPNPDLLLELVADHADVAAPHQLKDFVCMVGNQDSDKQAAQYAGVSFKWAHEMFGWNSEYIERVEGSHSGWFWNRGALELYREMIRQQSASPV